MAPRTDPHLYVPVLPVLPGDMEGVAHASRQTQQAIRPLFVVVKPRERERNERANFVVKAANRIIDCWRARGAPFVELFDEPLSKEADWWSTDHVLVLLHKYLRSRQVVSIPVIATDRKGEYRDAFMRVVELNELGFCVRLYEDDLELPSVTVKTIQKLSKDAGCKSSDVDLIIDLKRILPGRVPTLRSQVLEFLAALDHESKFRSVTVVGSSIPQNLYGIPENQDRDIPRLELELWRTSRAARGRHLLGLGDYLVVRPEYDDRSVNLKNLNGKIFYTLEECTRVLRGGSRQKKRLEDQYSELATRLIHSDVYKGENYSWGDGRIASSAARNRVTGRPVTWIAYSTSHHLELVAAQVAREVVATP